MSDEHQGIIFNIQKYSVHDGPGIRTVVFLKGCPLRCDWCSNPESQLVTPELAYNGTKCTACHQCAAVCPEEAITASAEGPVFIDRLRCKGCVSTCTEACVAQALIAYGRTATVNEVVDEGEKDAAFYSRSGGGMTLSGGEPLMQKGFALALLREAKRRRIKTNVETCGQVPTETLLEAAPLLNHIMFDLKHWDVEKHKVGTGVDNALILKNFHALTEAFPALPMVVRTPVIPGFNTSSDTIKAIARLVKEKQKTVKKISYELLPYHRLGTQKYTFLDRQSPLADMRLDQELFTQLQREAELVLHGD